MNMRQTNPKITSGKGRVDIYLEAIDAGMLKRASA
ncbi:hypothetical protein O206_22730 [Ochrobactrum sp. EGD-AQ16]|nr:hypothetical protein O206_22730 [Ochrobactrum sp. EGD-AQ16]